MKKEMITIDGNQAVASVAYQTNEVIAIYPITPSSPIGEWTELWSAEGKPNLWGTIPSVVEMQSEGGAAGAVHGALQTGSMATTFTASQGLLLMIPNMYKIAGELTSTVFHVAARSVAAQALSIFGDHSDVMAARSTGFAFLASSSVQEAQDLALIAQAASLSSRLPFIHFFDGFRTSHEVAKIYPLSQEQIRAMIEDEFVFDHRQRGLSPNNPVIRGTAQNPDVFFQARESVNSFYFSAPELVRQAMNKFAALVGRSYSLFEYSGPPDAERVIVLMGSGAETVEETVNLLAEQGEKVGVVKVRLYRPFSLEHFAAALPSTVRSIAVLDRTKEPGAVGEPLYLDVVSALQESLDQGFAPFKKAPKVIGGRYGLSSKEFTPAMVKGIFDELKKKKPQNHFTIGIHDDVTHTSLSYDSEFSAEDPEAIRAVFYGLGSDGTVGANKNSIKIIGEQTENFAQGYFVYDSKKAGSITVSHLRFGPNPIRSSYLINQAEFVACHQFTFLERLDVLKRAAPGGTFLLNSPYGPEEVWDHLPRQVKKHIIRKELKFYVVDGYKVAKATGMGRRINTVLQACFFAISGVLPPDEAIKNIKQAIKKTYGKRGQEIVDKNYAAVDQALDHLHQVEIPTKVTGSYDIRPPVPAEAPEFVQEVLAPMIARQGDSLPVSALPIDGTYPVATSQWEKRNLALEIPVWDPDLCIQCGKCVLVCPHAVIREKVYPPEHLENAPDSFVSVDARWKEFPDHQYTLQVSPEDCTGCVLCVEACPVFSKEEEGLRAVNMAPQPPLREKESVNWEYFLSLPEVDRTAIKLTNVKNIQLLQPLFEFSGACSGCGETPYLKLLTQLFGDRTIIANATGCSSIFGGNLPTTPWAVNEAGRGPAWSNSLFEDNAEFGLGMRLTLDNQNQSAKELLQLLQSQIGDSLLNEIIESDQSTEIEIEAQRKRVEMLKDVLRGIDTPQAKNLLSLSDALVKKSVWIVGGDGWAYDIGFGGLDHVLASGRNVNVLVMDTEVYSNTGGQASKATPAAASAKFAVLGKELPKKDLGMIAMSYGYVYVANVAMGAKDSQTIKAFLEAEAYDGPSLIIAYSHCIAQGIDMTKGLTQQKLAVDSGYWPLYRYHPEHVAQGKPALKLDSKAPSIPFEDYAYNEDRFRMILNKDEARAETLMKTTKDDIKDRWDLFQRMTAKDIKNRN